MLRLGGWMIWFLKRLEDELSNVGQKCAIVKLGSTWNMSCTHIENLLTAVHTNAPITNDDVVSAELATYINWIELHRTNNIRYWYNGYLNKMLSSYAFPTKLAISMQYYTLKLYKENQDLCTIIMPFGKCKYARLLIGLKCSPDITQAKMEISIWHWSRCIHWWCRCLFQGLETPY